MNILLMITVSCLWLPYLDTVYVNYKFKEDKCFRYVEIYCKTVVRMRHFQR